MDKVLYQCDPTKNTACNRLSCSYTNSGTCLHTVVKDYAVDSVFSDSLVVVVDPLQHMLTMQAGFQNRVDPRYNSKDLKERAAFLRDHFVFCDQELQEMLYDIPFFKHWKDYSKMTEQELTSAYDKAKDELIDAWHFFMNLSIGLGMDADEFYQRYLNKHKENIRRQDEGYDHTMKHI